MKNANISLYRTALRTSSALVMAAAIGAPAFAQDAAQPAQDEVASETIVVTGSRIARPNLEGSSPVTVINSEEVKLQGVTRTEDLLNALPQVFAGQGSFIANGASGTATVNLRGLGSERTLVLINGRRLLPGDPFSSAADINAVPSALIERVDVLTGGASSVYGADAVAGVVNFVMDTNFEGFRLDGQYSFYQHSNGAKGSIIDALNESGFGYPDGSSTNGGAIDVTGSFGASFDDGRGHVMAYAGYRKVNAALQASRDYSSCALASLAEGGFSCSGSSTSARGRFLVPGIGNFQPTADRQFVPGFELYNFAPANHFQRPDERYTLGGFAEYEISSAIRPYMEVMFMDDRTVAQIAPSGDFGNTTTLNCDNPLLSDQQKSILCVTENLVGFRPVVEDDPATAVDESDPGSDPTQFVDALGNPYFKANALLLRRNVEGGNRQDDLQHTSFRIVGGVRGDLGTAWSYDAYYQFGRVNFAETYLNDFSVTRVTRALDVVTDPATGNPVCRSVLDGTDPNCVPWDVFTLNGVSPEATAYLGTPGFTRGITEERVASASITGLLGEYGMVTPWAVDGAAINVGAEYRKESVEFNSDVAFQTGDLAGQGAPTLPIAGSFDVKEVFGELRVPIVQDSFIQDLTFETGYRYSDYNSGFSTDTYKFALELAPVEDIRFRASYNRAVRAPNIQDLFATQRVALNGNTDPCAGDLDPTTETGAPDASAAQCALTGVTAAQYGNIDPNPAAQYNGLIGGNPNLTPETADTYTVGAVITPRFLPGFSATVDWFNIKIKDTITGIGQDTILNTCINTGDPTFCSLIHRDQFGSLWLTPNGFVTDLTQNIGSLETRGIDVSASYNTDVGTMGGLSFSIVGTWLDTLITDNGVSDPYDCATFYGLQCGTPNPAWRHKARLTWTTPWDLGLSLQWRYFGGVDLDVLSSNPTLASAPPAPEDARIGSQSYFDLSATYRAGDNYSFRLGVNNLFDRDPPIVGSDAQASVSSSGNTYPQVYDALGRYVYVGATLDF